MFSEAGLLDDPKFTVSPRIPCQIGRAQREFPINYRFGNPRRPVALFQRVNLADERSIDSASYMFEWLVKSGVVAEKERCAALFELPSEAEPIRNAEAQLAEHCVPIEVSSVPEAAARVKFVAFPNGILAV